jgi:outer membrane immunogenic protein
MKKALFGALAAGALFASGYARAADLPPAPIYTKAPAPVVADNWTGFYLGGSIGGRWSDPTWTTTCVSFPCFPLTHFLAFATGNPNASFEESTVRLGGYFGYNLQLSPLWVAGLEGDFAYGNASHTMAGVPGLFTPILPPMGATSSIKEGWDGSVRARLGFLVTPAVLVYGTGGAAWQRTEASVNCTATDPGCTGIAEQETYSRTMAGWTIGGGVEGMLWGNWLVRLEYRYSDYGTLQHIFFANTPVPPPMTSLAEIAMSAPIATNMVTVGLAYKFGPAFAK